ncbi:MAG: creatininase family protein [Armatimonadetes bacterium]|nr:creatininase family protein [Armatimonadota bacterium]
MKYAELNWPQLRDVSRETVVMAPVASCEQHGPFLPFFTDTILLEAVTTRAEARLGDEALLLPTQWLGASQHHLPYGTITADVNTHARLVLEICESVLRDGFRRVLVLNGHGGNANPVQMALRQLDVRHPDAVLAGASYWEVAGAEIAAILEGPRKTAGHACEMETAMMLHLRPDLVCRERIADGERVPAPALRGVSIARNAAEWGKDGVLGFPTHASAAKGERLMAAIVDRVVAVVRELRRTGPDGLRVGP